MRRTSNARRRLIDAGLDLIRVRGYGAVSIDLICEKADVCKGSFYHFFASKVELAIAVLENDWISFAKSKWDALFSAEKEPLIRIQNYLEWLYEEQAEVVQKHGRVLGCLYFCVASEMSTREEPIVAKARTILGLQSRYLESAIREAQAEGSVEPGDAALKANGAFLLVKGSLTQARIQNDLGVLRTLPTVALKMLGVLQTRRGG
jgi:TetR/AcrR family transcriptional repressor of nem operon